MWDAVEVEIAVEMAGYAAAEVDGLDPLTYAGRYHVDRWAEYEVERRERREADRAFHAAELDRWRRANRNRARKRRGLHLSNLDRVRLAERLRHGATREELADEVGVSVATAGTIGQLVLFDVAE